MGPAVRTVLIQTPLWGFVPPLSLAQLTGELKSKGLPVRPIDLNIELFRLRGEGLKHTWSWEQNTLWLEPETVEKILSPFSEHIRRRCVSAVPLGEKSLVGFSVNECSIVASLFVARMIKAARPEAFVVFGGQAFAEPDRIERCLRDPAVDAIVMHDGERTLVELVERLSEGRDPLACPGLYVRGEKGAKPRWTGDREPVDLDSIAFCDFEALDLSRYEVPENLYSKSLMIMASRGCVRHCSFCGSRKPWEGYRYMSGKRIYDEIKHQLARHPHLTELKFYDIVTNGSMKRVLDLCDLIIADGTIKLSWEETNCIVRPDLTYEALCKMKAAGCHRITFGIESGSNRVLELMKKGQTVELAERVLFDVHRAGMVATANMMFGFPGETEEDFEQTLAFARRVHKFVDLFYPSRTFTTMEPLSDMAANRKELGIDDGTDIFWGTLDGSNTYPIRLERYQRFSKLLAELGARESQGLNSGLELNKWYSLGEYYEYKKELEKAADCYRKYLELDPESTVVKAKLERCAAAHA